MAFEGGRIIRERVAKYNIQCDLKDGGVFAALTSKQMGHLESQKRLWERFGHTQLELMDQKRIREVVACDSYVGGMLDMSGGHIHPLNLALGEAAAVESLGGIIYEQTPAIRIERGANPVVHTAGQGPRQVHHRRRQRLPGQPGAGTGRQVHAVRHPGDHHRAAGR
jgi:gamma-glutamylputrescine oxidase